MKTKTLRELQDEELLLIVAQMNLEAEEAKKKGMAELLAVMSFYTNKISNLVNDERFKKEHK